MTQVFTDDGKLVSVTAIEAGPCPVLAIREKSIQVGFGLLKEAKVNKPAAGYFKKLNVAPRRFIRELLRDPAKEYRVGEEQRRVHRQGLPGRDETLALARRAADTRFDVPPPRRIARLQHDTGKGLERSSPARPYGRGPGNCAESAGSKSRPGK